MRDKLGLIGMVMLSYCAVATVVVIAALMINISLSRTGRVRDLCRPGSHGDVFLAYTAWIIAVATKYIRVASPADRRVVT